MLSRIYSAAVDAYEVEIEVNAAGGNPRIVIVGLPDTAIKESQSRVTTAISNSGYYWRGGTGQLSSILEGATPSPRLDPEPRLPEKPCFLICWSRCPADSEKYVQLAVVQLGSKPDASVPISRAGFKKGRTHLHQFDFLSVSQKDNIQLLLISEHRSKEFTDFFRHSLVATKLATKAEGNSNYLTVSYSCKIGSQNAFIALKEINKPLF